MEPNGNKNNTCTAAPVRKGVVLRAVVYHPVSLARQKNTKRACLVQYSIPHHSQTKQWQKILFRVLSRFFYSLPRYHCTDLGFLSREIFSSFLLRRLASKQDYVSIYRPVWRVCVRNKWIPHHAAPQLKSDTTWDRRSV